MTFIEIEIQVSSIRSRGDPSGVIFSGYDDKQQLFVAVCDFVVIPKSSSVHIGQYWQLTGDLEMRGVVICNKLIMQPHVIVSRANLIRPSGIRIIKWLSKNRLCKGVGVKKATQLYERFGEELIDIIEIGNVEILTTVVSEDIAISLCNAVSNESELLSLIWLDQLGISRRMGENVVSFFGKDTIKEIKNYPYILCSFGVDWDTADTAARNLCSISCESPLRLVAAIEETLNRAMKRGHTCLPYRDLKIGLNRILKNLSLCDLALTSNSISNKFEIHNKIYQSFGMSLIERYISDRLNQLILKKNIVFSSNDLESLIDKVSQSSDATNFQLTPDQRGAIKLSLSNNFSLIIGSAGTGKTAVLRTIYSIYELVFPSADIIQIALTGMAAKRMKEASGRDSYTIASFINRHQDTLTNSDTLVVVDEMSMVDVILMYKLLRFVPDSVHIILIGDPFQLPPIGPGLVLQVLSEIKMIPHTELTAVLRQDAKTGIPEYARLIRNCFVPEFDVYCGKRSGLQILSCKKDQINNIVQKIYYDLGGFELTYEVQVLSAMKSNPGGVNDINYTLHQIYSDISHPVSVIDESHCVSSLKIIGSSGLGLSLNVGDLVMYTTNDYDLGLRNGSLGVVTKALTPEFDKPCCVCVFDDVEYYFNNKHVQNLVHSYAISIHKSQGSQFQRVIIPIIDSDFLDHSLIYTAITRGIDQVVLVGDIQACYRAIRSQPKFKARHVKLKEFLIET